MSTNDPMTQERLDAIQERVDGVTSGPWDCYSTGAHEVFDAGEYADGDLGEIVAPVVTKLSDAVFIAHAREDIPALLAEVERLRALTTVDDDMVERGARALWGSGDIDDEEWRSLRECTREHYRTDARFVLDAALNPGAGS